MTPAGLLRWIEDLRTGLAPAGPAVMLRLRLVVEADGGVRFAAPGEAAGV